MIIIFYDATFKLDWMEGNVKGLQLQTIYMRLADFKYIFRATLVYLPSKNKW